MLRDVEHRGVGLPGNGFGRPAILVRLNDDDSGVPGLHRADDCRQVSGRRGDARLGLEGLQDLKIEPLGEIDEIPVVGHDRGASVRRELPGPFGQLAIERAIEPLKVSPKDRRR